MTFAQQAQSFIENLLRPTETCLVIGSFQQLNKHGELSDVCLAILAVFLAVRLNHMPPQKGQRRLILSHAFPLIYGIEIQSTGDLFFELSYPTKPRKVLHYKAETSSEKQNFVQRLLDLAETSPRGWQKKFSWYQHYLDQITSSVEVTVIPGQETLIDSKYRSARFSTVNQPASIHRQSQVEQYRASDDRDTDSFDLESELIRARALSRQQEFTEVQGLKILVGSWNVGGLKCVDGLVAWLLTLEESIAKPDLLVIGFQELDLSAEAWVSSGETARSLECDEAILRLMRMRGSYERVCRRQLVGLLICVYASSAHASSIKDVQSTSAGCGIMGIMANKGATAVRLSVNETVVCFVNSHLTHGDSKLTRRNQDFQDLSKRLLFAPDPLKSVFECDVLVWFGDLNYRLDGSLDRAAIQDLIEKKDWPALHKADQLRQQQELQSAFAGFSEGPLHFAPSYKYNTNSSIYDTSEKQRCPAYTDRILFWQKPGESRVQCTAYGRHEVLTSDHRPVTALLTIPVRTVVEARRQAVFADILLQISLAANAKMPDLKLSSQRIAFGSIRHSEAQTRTMTLTNQQAAPVRFRFKAKLDSGEWHKPWLLVSPPFGIVSPGTTATLSFTVNLLEPEWDSAGEPREELDDILILHVERGRDFFIEVSAHYQRSCFGLRLEDLVSRPGPIRTTARSPREIYSIPYELWMLVDQLNQQPSTVTGLFLESGNPDEMLQIRECLDLRRAFPAGLSPHSFAETLLFLLDNLEIPVIPCSLYEASLQASASYLECRSLVSRLPRLHYNLFYYIVAFARHLLARGQSKTLQPGEDSGLHTSRVGSFGLPLAHPALANPPQKDLAIVLASVLLRPLSSKARPGFNRRAKFLLHFLESEF